MFNTTHLQAAAAISGATSLVDQIFQMVVKAVQAGQLTAGRRLPSVRQLADDCNVSRDTVARAYDKLVAHGFVEARRGSGCYVKLARRTPRQVERHPPWSDQALSHPYLWHRQLVRPLVDHVTHMGSGVMPAAWINESEIAQAMRNVARSNHRLLASHTDPQGYLPLREIIQSKLLELGINAEPKSLMTTVGASEALHLVIQAFYFRVQSEIVLGESPGPFMLLQHLAATGLDIAFVPREADGPNLEVLRALCEQHKPRFFFCSSVLQNPTSSYMTPHKAFQLLRLAEEFDLTIVEDDSYSDLAPSSMAGQLTRLATLDQLKRVIYIGSFSMTLAVGLRVGFIAASPERVQWLTQFRSANIISNSTLAERTVLGVLSEGNYRRICDQLISKLDEQRESVIEQLEAIGIAFDHKPESGLFLWGRLGEKVDALSLARTMLESGHLTAPGSAFSSDSRYEGYMRFNIGMTHSSPAITALAKLLGRP
ncbi:MAG TPA: PLP-dependent aminotransferase family protein [Ramlibacter sp.]|nr:PLP-dependent aminotransferase family protein [Ramlibacter sp.]